jgi:hypothetical protein
MHGRCEKQYLAPEQAISETSKLITVKPNEGDSNENRDDEDVGGKTGEKLFP